MESPAAPRRIALAVEGTRGDVHPMLALGQALGALGHEPLVCAPPECRGDSLERGLEFHPVGVDVRAYLEEKAQMPHAGPGAMLAEGLRHFERSLPLQFRALCTALEVADLVLAAGTPLAAASVAELFGIPYRLVA